MFNSLSTSPGMLYERDKFNLGLEVNARASDDAIYILNHLGTKVEAGSYDKTLSPLFNTTNDAFATVAASLGYKHFGFSYFNRGVANAVLNNPIYPNADAVINIDKGFSLGYGNEWHNFIFGLSVSTYTRNSQLRDANVLNYKDGVVLTQRTYTANTYNYSLGYLIFPQWLVIMDYKKDSLDGETLGMGSRYHFRSFNFYAESHDLQYNNVQNSLHFGVDYTLWILKLSAGLNQLYPTYGVAIDCKYFNLTAGRGEKNIYQQYRKPYDSYVVGLSLGYNI